MSESFGLSDLDELFELIAVEWEGISQVERVRNELRDAFLSSNPPNPDSLSLYDVILGLAYAMKRTRFGLWLDHGEAYLLHEESVAVIERRVGRPDAFWKNPDSYDDFAWSGTDVVGGLAAFSNWLARDSVASIPSLAPRRLVSVNTGSDFFLAFVSREDSAPKLIELLAAFGLRSEVLVGQLEGGATADNLGRSLETTMSTYLVRKPELNVKLLAGSTFTIVPDFLENRGHALVDGHVQLTYLEAKASAIQTPTSSQLTDTQAVFVDAILNGGIESISSTNAELQALVNRAGASGFDVVGFELHVFDIIE